MTLDEKKSEILAAFKKELSEIGIAVEEGDVRSELSGPTWSIWIEQKGGLNTKADKFLVDLDELNEGVNYIASIVYRVRRWSNLFGNKSEKVPVGSPWRRGDLAPILIAEDDPDDRLFINRALKANLVKNPLVSVSDGEELLDYLHSRGKFSGANDQPAPCLILLDLNMPRMDGRQALRAIKKDENLRKIPVVILTTSIAEEDILNGYQNGVNSYVTKPASVDGFVNRLQVLQDYWLNIVQLPPRPNAWS